MTTKNVLAFDLGAGSGRAVLAKFDGNRFSLNEIHRFPHNFSILNGHSYWNILLLMDEIKKGFSLCREEVSGAGFDTWGVDCGFIDKEGNLAGIPLSYRDAALDNKNMEQALRELGGEEFMAGRTGIACLAYNTIYKLYYMKKHMPSQLAQADKLLFMPNLFEYLLSGIKHAEYSIASTSQMYDMANRAWAYDILDKAGIDKNLLPDTDYAGRDLGPLRSDVASETGQKGLHIISVPGHDTACAVAAMPAKEQEFTFLSSGTWSLLGISSTRMLGKDSIIHNKISNEGTWNGTYRPVVNIIGLWIMQELRRNFATEGRDYSFAEISRLASLEKSLRSFIRPDDFMLPGDYPLKIREYCKNTGQEVPQTDGGLARCVLESLALKYRQVYEGFKPYITWEEKLYITGGGVRDELLCQFTANALDIPVIAVAAEATAAGNIMVQLKALGLYNTDSEKSEILSASFETKTYYPQETERWHEAYLEFCSLYQREGKAVL
ncbi:MAG: rhamnulokinase [Lachnospiraceae bacterium]|nr:rhamnulokinase [Lachnospiraceae bacterium]